MKIQIAAAALTLALAGPAFGQETYNIDPAHSQPGFEVQHIGGFSLQRGSFGRMTGKIVLDRAAKKGTVDVSIDTTSIKALTSGLEAHLKSEDFFNAEKYPTMTFKSSALAFDGERLTRVDGELTMLGVTRPVSLRVANFVCGEHPFNKKPMCGAEAIATLKRSDWGMNYGYPKAVGDDVKLTMPIEAYKE